MAGLASFSREKFSVSQKLNSLILVRIPLIVQTIYGVALPWIIRTFLKIIYNSLANPEQCHLVRNDNSSTVLHFLRQNNSSSRKHLAQQYFLNKTLLPNTPYILIDVKQ
jgi:hypothetical protein